MPRAGAFGRSWRRERWRIPHLRNLIGSSRLIRVNLDGDGFLLGLAVTDIFRNIADIPDETEGFHELQAVVGDVDFPPVEALSGRSWVVMMVVVPPFSKCNQRKDEVISA